MHLFSYHYSIVRVQPRETKKNCKMFPTFSPFCSQYRTAIPRRWPPYRDQSQPGMNHGSLGSCSARYRSRVWPRDIPHAQSARHLGQRGICCRTQRGNHGGWWPQLVRDWCKWSRDHLGPFLCFQPADDRRWCSLGSQVVRWNIWAGFDLSHAPLQHSKLSQHLHLNDKRKIYEDIKIIFASVLRF